MLQDSWEITVPDVQLQSENLLNAQETATTDQHLAAPENLETTSEPLDKDDIFDDHQVNTSFGWNERKLSEAVTFGGNYTKSTSTFITDDMKEKEESSTLPNTDLSHDSIHDVMPDMDTAGLWISSAPAQQTLNETHHASQAHDKTNKPPPENSTATPKAKTNNHRLPRVALCASLSIVGLFIYLNPDNTHIKPSGNISHHIKTTYNETLTHVEKRSNEIYIKIMSKFKNKQTGTPEIQKTQEDTPKEQIQTGTPALTLS